MTQPMYQRVLVRPEGVAVLNSGVMVADAFEPYNCQSQYGTVIALPTMPMPYLGEAAAYNRLQVGGGSVLGEVIENISLRESTVCNLAVGDSILLHYRYFLPDIDPSEKIGDLLNVHFSDIYAKIGDGGELLPQNGQIFVIPSPGHSVAVSDGKRPCEWLVIAEGDMVSGYEDGSFADTEFGWPMLVGRRVLIDPGIPIGLEAPLFAAKEGGGRIHTVHRKHICAFLNS